MGKDGIESDLATLTVCDSPVASFPSGPVLTDKQEELLADLLTEIDDHDYSEFMVYENVAGCLNWGG